MSAVHRCSRSTSTKRRNCFLFARPVCASVSSCIGSRGCRVNGASSSPAAPSLSLLHAHIPTYSPTPRPTYPPDPLIIARGITPLPLTPVCFPPLKGAFLRICVPAAGGSLVAASSADARGVRHGRSRGRHWLRRRAPGCLHGAKPWKGGQWSAVTARSHGRRSMRNGLGYHAFLLHTSMFLTI